MNPHEEHIISLAVDTTSKADIVKAFEVLSRVASSLALDGLDVRISHFVHQFEYENSEEDL